MKYELHKNDLKYKEIRNIDIEKVEWTDHVSLDLYTETDQDTLIFRVEDSKKMNYDMLDLNYMKLTIYPNINEMINIKCLRYLFITNNKLDNLPSLTNYDSLQVIDLSDNNIRGKLLLPKSLIELKCSNNKITELPNENDCCLIERIDCENNLLTNIPKYEKLKILNCASNNITILLHYENIVKINCENNVNLSKIDVYDKLTELIINNTNLEKLNEYKKLTYLQMYKTKIVELPFMKNLTEIEANDTLLYIHENYKKNKDDKIKIKSFHNKLYICIGV
jgi:hypothetical protein